MIGCVVTCFFGSLYGMENAQEIVVDYDSLQTGAGTHNLFVERIAFDEQTALIAWIECRRCSKIIATGWTFPCKSSQQCLGECLACMGTVQELKNALRKIDEKYPCERCKGSV